MAQAREATPDEVVKTVERLAEVDTPTPEEPKEEPKEDSQSTEVETAEKPDETPTEGTEEAPADTKDAKAFAEMRNQIKELREQLSQREEAPVETNFNVPANTRVDVNNYYDQQTGDFDAIAYQNAVAEEARMVARQEVEDFRQTQEAYIDYPELNPTGKSFDKKFFQATRGTLLDSMVRPSEYGKQLTLKEAAEFVSGLSAKTRKQLADEGAQAALKEIAAKESASLEAGGSSGRVTNSESVGDYEALSDETKRGGREGALAAAERLKKLGI